MARGRLEPPDLDDRTWQDIKNQAIALIPKYAPEWTDHNPSDLGIALIELFAWMVEGLIYRLNQVPEKTYIHLLNLIGITRDPATPASTLLTFQTHGDIPIDVPQGTQVSTQPSVDAEAVAFETDGPVRVLPVTLKAARFTDHRVTATGKSSTNDTDQPVRNDEDVTDALIRAPKGTSHLQGLRLEITDENDAEIMLGFDKPATEPLHLYFRFMAPFQKATEEQGLPTISLQWSYYTGNPVWGSLSQVVTDKTQHFRVDGVVEIGFGLQEGGKTIGSNWAKHKLSENDQDNLYWIKLVITLNKQADTGETKQTGLILGLQQIAFNSVLATNALTVKEEFLGTSTGEPFQHFELIHRPLFKQSGASRPYDHVHIEVNEAIENNEPQWETWEAADEMQPGSGRQFRVDPITGTVYFGNGEHGKIPQEKSKIRATYRYVAGGGRSNVPANTITVIQTPNDLRGQVEIWNGDRANGGSDEESVEETKRRAPQALRNRDRAVTIRDYEFLAREASTQIAKARALEPRLNDDTPQSHGGLYRDRGHVCVIIIPQASSTEPARAPLEDPTPQPSEMLLQEVLAYLEGRRPLTTKLHVTGPRYIPIHINVKLTIWKSAIDLGLVPAPESKRYDDYVEEKYKVPIRKFLHPTVGGLGGTGWEMGQDFVISGLLDLIRPSSDIGFISDISAEVKAPLYDPPSRPFSLKATSVWVPVADYEIVCSGEHTVDHKILQN